MTTVDNKFNQSIADIEDAQTEIRLIVKNAFMYGWTKETVNKRIGKVIDNAVKGITIERLKKDAVKSLWNFANNQRVVWQNSGLSPLIVSVIIAAANGKSTTRAERKFSPQEAAKFRQLTFEQKQKGVPLREFYGGVWREKVKPTLDKLCKQNALDPTDLTGRNSLRNLAEMEVRYQEHKDNVTELKNKNVKLVICSSHADCSDRCKPYQGRIYSLDGSSGTIGGKSYVPIEEATQNAADQYTTKAGRTYQNGLLGFNCRHKLYEYKGQAIPTVSEADRKREYAITRRQREMERDVRAAKTEALMYNGINDKYARLMQKRAKALYDKYIAFCQENKRAYYPMRVAI